MSSFLQRVNIAPNLSKTAQQWIIFATSPSQDSSCKTLPQIRIWRPSLLPLSAIFRINGGMFFFFCHSIIVASFLVHPGPVLHVQHRGNFSPSLASSPPPAHKLFCFFTTIGARPRPSLLFSPHLAILNEGGKKCGMWMSFIEMNRQLLQAFTFSKQGPNSPK